MLLLLLLLLLLLRRRRLLLNMTVESSWVLIRVLEACLGKLCLIALLPIHILCVAQALHGLTRLTRLAETVIDRELGLARMIRCLI